MDGYEIASYLTERATTKGYDLLHEVLGALFNNLMEQHDIIDNDLMFLIERACCEWNIG